MRFYKVKILKTGANHFIEKNVCTENIELAKDIVIQYLLKLCVGEELYQHSETEYFYKSSNNDEISFRVNFSIPSKNLDFEFKIELIRDYKLERFPEEIDVFNFINFSIPSAK